MAAASLLALNIYLEISKPGNPLRYYVPQEVIGETTIHVGGNLMVRRVKCNESDQPIAISSQGSFYRRVDVPGQYVASQAPGATIVIGPNVCDEAIFSGPLPDGVTPGTWRRQGIDCTVDTEERWCRSWYTDEFKVIP